MQRSSPKLSMERSERVIAFSIFSTPIPPIAVGAVLPPISFGAIKLIYLSISWCSNNWPIKVAPPSTKTEVI